MRLALRLLAPALIGGFSVAEAKDKAPPMAITVDAGPSWDSRAGESSSGKRDAERIVPVWARQNVWMPWARWNPDDTATLPRFDEHVEEVALIMATGYRPDTMISGKGLVDVSVPDLYDDSAGIRKPFDPRHPFFNALRRLKALGIRPVVDLGPVPRKLCRKPHQGPFRWNTAGPSDYRLYYEYMRDLFVFLQGPAGFTREEVEGWRFQLLREPDNHEVWDPKETGHSLAGPNLEEYKVLYDHTLAAMRAAGLRVNLAFGNLMVAHPGAWIFKESWAEALCRHLADTAGNRAPGLLRLPRIRGPEDTLLFSFTAYGGHHTQTEDDPRRLGILTERFRAIVRAHFPRNPLEITVGEGNLFGRQLHHRSDGSELGAAWTAAIYKVALDHGLSRYQQWGFTSAPHASLFREYDGLPGGPYNVTQMFRRLAGGRRLAVTPVPSAKLKAPAYADAIAAAGPDSSLKVILFHYRPERGVGDPLDIALHVHRALPGRVYEVRHLRVDKDRGHYLNQWHRDLRAAGQELQVPWDACMEYQFNVEQWKLWLKRKDAYRGLARLQGHPSDSLTRVRADAAGRLRKRLALPPNSVSLLELAPLKPLDPAPGTARQEAP